MTREEYRNLVPGDKVHYRPLHGAPQNGVFKGYGPDDTARVVYKCNNNWENYEMYTSELTDTVDLQLGWVDENGNPI